MTCECIPKTLIPRLVMASACKKGILPPTNSPPREVSPPANTKRKINYGTVVCSIDYNVNFFRGIPIGVSLLASLFANFDVSMLPLA